MQKCGSFFAGAYLLCCHHLQGKFRLKKKPKDEVASSQPKAATPPAPSQSEVQEDLPNLDDPEVQRATVKIQVD